MEEPEYLGEIEIAREHVGTAGFDQAHAGAIEVLRRSRAFILFSRVPLPGEIYGIQSIHLIPSDEGDDEFRELRLAFADTLERTAQDIRETL